MTDSVETPEPQPQGEGTGKRRGRRAKRGPLGRLALFYRQVVAELRKVVWPSRRQLSTYTTAVIVFVIVVICILTVIDFGFSRAVEYVFG
ncbi:preprotein translocase subunit SecE [Streptomyces sp. 8K308]|uniref:Protein translocase subunit SecE n=1 Tax=Streptomyces millisiae TaxID=3075542 RepID=A0ABU2LZC7_9ACTN|nr:MULTISPECIES: preprotein translocase subunit SecE [unclassified Streptomyces]MDT0322921.1 preprotein translocase subunit SecE [Streptomyces sp. DSM 44918]TDC12635.1 preprotein translocase subunit SecE [Streptomyces sp. 8K308]